MRKSSGFTLVEIAIGLVIVGLMVGGILKGQELITGARVHNIITAQESVKGAFFGFVDRHRALPGDYMHASMHLKCAPACVNGDGNGRIQPVGGAPVDEHIAAWQHLAAAGFIEGSYTYAPAPETKSSAPVNPYTRFLRLTYDNVYGNGLGVARHNVKTGNNIPSNLLGEVDLKIDDGNPNTGSFQFSIYDGGPGGTAPDPAKCISGQNWATATVEPNCGGASIS